MAIPNTNETKGRLRDSQSVKNLVFEAEARRGDADQIIKLLVAPGIDGSVLLDASRDGVQVHALDWFSINLLFKYKIEANTQITKTPNAKTSEVLYRLFSEQPPGLWRAPFGFEDYESALKEL